LERKTLDTLSFNTSITKYNLNSLFLRAGFSLVSAHSLPVTKGFENKKEKISKQPKKRIKEVRASVALSPRGDEQRGHESATSKDLRILFLFGLQYYNDKSFM